MAHSKELQAGDFVKHKENPHMVFQVVDVLESVNKGAPGMVRCIQVHDVRNYLESDLVRCELTDDIRERLGLD